MAPASPRWLLPRSKAVSDALGYPKVYGNLRGKCDDDDDDDGDGDGDGYGGDKDKDKDLRLRILGFKGLRI